MIRSVPARSAMVLLVAPLLMLAGSQTAGAAAPPPAQDTEPYDPPQSAEMTWDEIPPETRALLEANEAVRDFVTNNTDLRFRLGPIGTQTGILRVEMLRGRAQHGLVMIRDGEIIGGRVGSTALRPPPRTLSSRPAGAPAPVTPERLAANERARIRERAQQLEAARRERQKEGAAQNSQEPTSGHVPGAGAQDAPGESAAGEPEAPAGEERPSGEKPAAVAPAEEPGTGVAPGPSDAAGLAPPSTPVRRAQAAESSPGEPQRAVGDAGETRLAPAAGSQAARDWLPMTGGTGLMWLAIVVTLVLMVRLDAIISLRNLDALVLAGSCVLLMLRWSQETAAAGGQTLQWWSYLLLTSAAAYWLLRGLLLTRARRAAEHVGNVSPGAMLVLGSFGLAVALTQVATAPLSPASRDGLIGGHYFASTGKLPHGQTVGVDQQSPLLYVLHGAAAKIAPVHVLLDGNRVPPEWGERDKWMVGNWWEGASAASARWVNGFLLLATLAALVGIGSLLDSLAAGLTMATVFCVFPGAVECLPRPEVMLPTALASWALALSLLPGAGGLLSGFAVIVAGIGSPWLWLLLPVLLGFNLRRGVSGFGNLLGAGVGVAAVLAGLVWFVAPSVARADGALAAAGIQPPWVGTISDNTTLTLAPRTAGAPSAPDWVDRAQSAVWRWLLNDGARLQEPTGAVPPWKLAPAGMNPADISFHDVDVTQGATEYQDEYARRMSSHLIGERLVAVVRTAAEATSLQAAPPANVESAWAAWAAWKPGSEAAWNQARRLTKLGAGVMTLLVALLLFSARQVREFHLVGGFLAVSAAVALASSSGAVGNLAMLLPSVLALIAVNGEVVADATPRVALQRMRGEAANTAPAAAGSRPPAVRSAGPRISIEK
ncbi:MAG: hypothetical protein CHACPFDD_01213 [Phycisphaerae bacterium]|nr:hypothetical protein [Phycisphaerae bacterium]